MQYPEIYHDLQNQKEPTLLSGLTEGENRISLGDSGRMACTVKRDDRCMLLSARFELKTSYRFLFLIPPHLFLASLNRKGTCIISTWDKLQILIPQGCGQIIHCAAGKIYISLNAGITEILQIYFPARLISRLQKHYLLLQDFLFLSREGKGATLFPFPRVFPDNLLTLAKRVEAAELPAVLWTCLLEELQAATAEWLDIKLNGTDQYDEKKFYQAILLLLTSPDQRMTTSQLARTVQINEFRLKRGFKQKFNMSLHAFQENIRIEKAKAWVQENNEPLSRIATELGYSSLSHFSAAFKKGTGIRPGFYRRQLQQRTGNMNEVHQV